MSTRFLPYLTLLLLLIRPTPTTGEDLYLHPSEMPVKPLKIDFPEPDRRVLSNGMVIYLREQHEIPVIEMRARIRTGSYLVEDDELGLADMTGGVMRTGGTASFDPDEIDEKLEFVAARVETDIGSSLGTAMLWTLEKDLDEVFDVFVEVLRRPRFDSDRIELRRGRVLESIRRRNDDPGDIVSREFSRIVFAGHPFGRVSTIKSVSSITRQDLLEFHRKSFFPNNIILGVTGDFDSDAMIARLEEAFGDWEARDGPLPDPPPKDDSFDARIHFIEKDVTQAHIRMGHLGVLQKDPDYFNLKILDDVIGANGFNSRMMKEIRSDRGLAYSVGTSISGGRVRGTIQAFCQTKIASTVETLGHMIRILEEAREQEVQEAELELAKDSILNQFVFWFTSADQVVRQQMSLEIAGLPTDWLELYHRNIEDTRLADVTRVARKHLHPRKMTIVIVGKRAALEGDLESLGFEVVPRPLDDFEE